VADPLVPNSCGASNGSGPWPDDPVERAAAVAATGLRRPVAAGAPAALAALVADDPDGRVRAAALGALARLPDPPPGGLPPSVAPAVPGGSLRASAWLRAAADTDPAVRRRAADLAPAFARPSDNRRSSGTPPVPQERRIDLPTDPALNRRSSRTPPVPQERRIVEVLVELLGDGDAAVAEAAAWALGEVGDGGAVPHLTTTATAHRDPLVREAAVAALGAIGDPGGLDAVLAACADKPAIRRRAVLALAAFEGPAVDAALQAALTDKDWQTRQAAEDLLN